VRVKTKRGKKGGCGKEGSEKKREKSRRLNEQAEE
jgi:hypothetical protein